MKILILGSKEFPIGTNKGDDSITSGGIEFYTQELARALAKQKQAELVVVTRKFIGSPHIEKLQKNIIVYRVNWKRGFWTRTPSFIWNSFWLARRLDFDIILAGGQVATFFSIFLGKLRRKPVVSIPHGIASGQPQYGKFVNTFGRIIEKWTFNKPKAVVALSNNDVKKLGQIINKNKIVLIPTGINLKKFSGKTASHHTENIIILSTSRLIKVKGLEYLIDSARHLKGKYEIWLAGTGPEGEALKAQASGNDKIKFLGFRRDVPDLLSKADIFVLPSLSEGLPMSLLEAMASSKACAVTDIGLPVEDGKTGLVVPPGDVDKLASAIQKLIDDKKLRHRIANNAHRFVSQFTWDNCAKEFVELFDNLA